MKDDEIYLRRMRIADFAGVTYGTSRKLQAADNTKASVSPYAALCGIALKAAAFSPDLLWLIMIPPLL